MTQSFKYCKMEKKSWFSKQKLYNTIKGAFDTGARNKNTNASGLFQTQPDLTTSTKSLERTIHFKVLEV